MPSNSKYSMLVLCLQGEAGPGRLWGLNSLTYVGAVPSWVGDQQVPLTSHIIIIVIMAVTFHLTSVNWPF